MPPIRVADIKEKLKIEYCSLAQYDAWRLRHQEIFEVTQEYCVSRCYRVRKVIQELQKELENHLIFERKKLNHQKWSDEQLTHNWENGLANYKFFKDVNKARKVQFAYITTGSGAALASILALLSGKVAVGTYKNPGDCPGWNSSRKSWYMPKKATAAREYATPNKDAPIEAEIAPRDEAILDDSMSSVIEHPGELSPTVLAQNARASRIAIRQRKAARGSATGSSMMLSERDGFLDELPPSTNAQATNDNSSSMFGVRGKTVRRFAAGGSAAGSSMVLSEHDEFLDELPPSTNAQEAVKKPFKLSWIPATAARSSATETFGMRPQGPSRGYTYDVAPPNSDYKGEQRIIKVWEPNEEDGPMIELPRATIQNIAVQTLYPQLFKLDPDCDEDIKRIFEMPETRKLDLAKDHGFSLDDITHACEPHRLEAALGQIRGVVARKPCTHCKSKNSKGPFATCVVVPGESFGACCNCIYEMPLNSRKCTLSEHSTGPQNAEAKAKHPLRAASVALRSYFPKLRSMKSLLAEGLKEVDNQSAADTQSAAARQRQTERVWATYPRF